MRGGVAERERTDKAFRHGDKVIGMINFKEG